MLHILTKPYEYVTFLLLGYLARKVRIEDMKLAVTRDTLTKNISENDLKYAIIEANSAELLIDLMHHSKPSNINYLQEEVFRNANQSLKLRMVAIVDEKVTGVNIDRFAYYITDAPRHTMNYNKRKDADFVELTLAEPTFEGLQEAVLASGDPMFMIDFAKNYKVNDQMFLDALKGIDNLYVKAYKLNVFTNSEYHQDEMQNM